jgi:hypothetical protein
LISQPQLNKRARDELTEMIVKPYLKENPDFKGLNVIEHGLNYENIWDLKFFTSCFLESLRLEPPVTVSSACMVSED